MVVERHAVARAEHPVSIRAVPLLLGGALEAADILPTLGLVVVAVGSQHIVDIASVKTDH
jgi:hypothetical protein